MAQQPWSASRVSCSWAHVQGRPSQCASKANRFGQMNRFSDNFNHGRRFPNAWTPTLHYLLQQLCFNKGAASQLVTPIKLARQNFVFAIRRFFRLNRPVAIIFPRRFSDYHLYAILQNFVIAILFIGDFLIFTYMKFCRTLSHWIFGSPIGASWVAKVLCVSLALRLTPRTPPHAPNWQRSCCHMRRTCHRLVAMTQPCSRRCATSRTGTVCHGKVVVTVASSPLWRLRKSCHTRQMIITSLAPS